MTCTVGERCHDLVVAHTFKLVAETGMRAAAVTRINRNGRAWAWRQHVLATAAERIARLDRDTFDWPCP